MNIRNPVLRLILSAMGFSSVSAADHRSTYVNRPPVQAHQIIPLVRYPKPVAWTGKSNQKKKRIARRRANAAGKRNAFA